MVMTEHSIQARVVQFVRTFYPDAMMFAIPNGANVNPVNRVRLVKEGMLAGVPDMVLLEQRHGFNGLFIEFKKDNGVVSKEQTKMLTSLTQRGYLCIVARHHRTAIAMIESYLQTEKPIA